MSFFDGINDYMNLSSQMQNNVVFLAFHGLLMIIIVIPWACVCITSMFLFYLVVNAHKADIDAYLRTVFSFFTESNRNSWAVTMQLAQSVRGRLAHTCSYFSHLYAGFIVIFYLLIMASVQDFNYMINGQSDREVYKGFQDGLYMFLGTVSLYCGLWTAHSLSLYWKQAIHMINDIPTQNGVSMVLSDLPIHSAVIAHLKAARVHYTVYSNAINGQSLWRLLQVMAAILLFEVFVLNYPATFVPKSP